MTIAGEMGVTALSLQPHLKELKSRAWGMHSKDIDDLMSVSLALLQVLCQTLLNIPS